MSILEEIIYLNKAILIIKAWWMYEGRILGSNIGWISTYTLEVLIVYILINYYDEIHSPIDVYFKFFEVDWWDYLVTIFGLLDWNHTYKEVEELAFIIYQLINSETNKEKEQRMKDHYKILQLYQEKFDELNEKYWRNLTKPSNTPISYFLNVIDPINYTNNLGKSINNFHSKRIKRILMKQRTKLSKLISFKRELSLTDCISEEDAMKYKQNIWSLFDKIYEVMAIKIDHDPINYWSQLKLASPQLKNFYYPISYLNSSPYNSYGDNMQYQMPSSLPSMSLNLQFSGVRGFQPQSHESSIYDSLNLSGDIQNIMKENMNK